ncbi:TetR family transcriptional regulator [Sinobacterium caligoides]|uniref:TetR family transcriptional regulator n=1 Tax=Sinobacterium caligoides TaxID=933926 RepID=A0A3N2DZR4_9GAMM|nr:TetR/AcrR family transcriptional regulator [Sinobacterium caligoides]ROS05356.1 TetR family transcriptional regulator [Sinobacterium caligoides]
MQTRPHNRKQQIVELAISLLQTRGFDSFSYQDLSRELGITKASIHHHFPKKSDLGVALCEAILAWHECEFNKARRHSGGAMAQLTLYLNGLMSYACGKDKICPLSSLQGNITMLPEEMRRAIKRLDEHEIDFITELLQCGRDNGEFTFSGNTRSQATIVVLTCKGALQYSRIHGSQVFDDTMKQIKILLN